MPWDQQRQSSEGLCAATVAIKICAAAAAWLYRRHTKAMWGLLQGWPVRTLDLSDLGGQQRQVVRTVSIRCAQVACEPARQVVHFLVIY